MHECYGACITYADYAKMKIYEDPKSPGKHSFASKGEPGRQGDESSAVEKWNIHEALYTGYASQRSKFATDVESFSRHAK